MRNGTISRRGPAALASRKSDDAASGHHTPRRSKGAQGNASPRPSRQLTSKGILPRSVGHVADSQQHARGVAEQKSSDRLSSQQTTRSTDRLRTAEDETDSSGWSAVQHDLSFFERRPIAEDEWVTIVEFSYCEEASEALEETKRKYPGLFFTYAD